ncbi:hypothetical protein [Streptomyces sp. NPDC012888]|uniref:hypothetical protein n=1 Tax=Streptomyces sp. NPDC012888 TaxID=3364855 RepID=UPI0036C6C9E1
MSGTRYALARALTGVCVVLLALFAPGPASSAVAGQAEPRPASSAPAEPAAPAEGPADPAADPEARAAVRGAARGAPVRRPSVLGARVAVVPPVRGHPYVRPALGHGFSEPVASRRPVRSVVLRC